MSFSGGRAPSDSIMSTLNLQELTDEQMVQEGTEMESTILNEEIKHEPLPACTMGSIITLHPMAPHSECEEASEFFSGKVRLYRDDDSKQFKMRNLAFRIKVFRGAEEFDIFESQ